MKKTRITLAIFCAIVLLCGTVFIPPASGETVPATPTDLEPADTAAESEQAEPEAPDSEETMTGEEEQADSLEIAITKSVLPGQTWAGTLKRRTPSILKLDLNCAQTVYILIEGKDVAASIRKADRVNDEVPVLTTDPETDRLIIELNGEEGSYLLFLRAGENSLLAKAEVSFMNYTAYEAWLSEEPKTKTEEQPETAGEEGTGERTGPETETVTGGEESEQDKETETNPENEPEQAEEETALTPPPERSISVHVTFDVPDPAIGDTAHFKAILTGYEDLDYTMQWQYSSDRSEWTDIAGEMKDTMDIVVTEENNHVYWRIVVYLEGEPAEEPGE